MPTELMLHTILDPRGPAGAIVLSPEQVAELGSGKQAFPVVVHVNGVALRLRVAKMGGEFLIGLNKSVRAEASVDIGDEIDVKIAFDDAPRTVEVPVDLEVALKARPDVKKRFDALALSHRKEFVRWITEAKREQTRADRVAKAVDMIAEGSNR